MNYVYDGTDFKDYGYVVEFISDGKYKSMREVCGNKEEILEMIKKKKNFSENEYRKIGISLITSYDSMLKKIKKLENYIQNKCK
jgi:hypothetical protein